MNWPFLRKWIFPTSLVILGVLLLLIGGPVIPTDQIVLRILLVILSMAILRIAGRLWEWRWRREMRIVGPIVILACAISAVVLETVGYLKDWAIWSILLIALLVSQIGLRRCAEQTSEQDTI